MILLLDSHAFIWWLGADATLADQARRAIADPTNSVVVSAASIWELAIKRALGKIDTQADLAAAVVDCAFSGLPITLEDAAAAASLPAHHRDPFDRMLVAQAQRLDAVIVTRDEAFDAYEPAVLRA